MREIITISTKIHASVSKVWEYFTSPEHIIKWNSASNDWHTPYAENDLRVGGKFKNRMEAKDGSDGFDFCGVYDVVILHETIAYTLDDGRAVKTTFVDLGNETEIIQAFEAENFYPVEMQKSGWQAILDNFKLYIENN